MPWATKSRRHSVLAIEVEYLLGRVYAAEFRDSATPEWPPHPARLFSALIAAYHDIDGTDGERAALLWLEKQEPPDIIASEAGAPSAVVDFVPTNYANKAGSTLPEQRTKQPRSFPAQSPATPIVRFVWPLDDVPEQHYVALQQLTARVTSLGRACSLVRVNAFHGKNLNLVEPPTYTPHEDGTTVLAVAGEGRLEELERTFALGRRPQQGAPARYLNVKADAQNVPARGHFGEMIILRRVFGTGLPVTATTILTRQLRKAFLDHAGKENPVLSGHDPDGKPTKEPHLAFVALPNVGGLYGDGNLMGLAVVLPASISSADRGRTLQACARIETLKLGKLGEWKLEIANFDVNRQTLKPETWMDPSKHWATVTPILLDRYPKKNLPAEELLVTACVRAGLPPPANCTYGAFTPQDRGLKGVPPVFAFSTDRWAVHAVFDFDTKVKGPILVGAGRFFGMGLMKPIRPPQQEISHS